MPNYGIHNYANREIGLTTPQVQMATFTPVELKWQGVDPEFLSKHLQYADAKDAEAQKEKTAIDMAYAEQRKKIHQDDKTRAEFDKIVEDYNKKVKDAVEASNGSYHRLGALMKDLASDNQGNKAIAAMTQQQEDYTKWKDDLAERRKAGKITDVRYRRLISEQERDWSSNSERYFKRDEHGNIVGTDNWLASTNVTDNLNQATFAAIMTQLTAYQEKTTSKSYKGPVTLDEHLKVNKQPYNPETDAFLGTSSSGKTYKIQSLTKEQLNDTLNKYIASNPAILTQFADEMDDLIFEYNEWEEKLKNPLLSDSDRFNLNAQINARASQIFGKGAGGGGFKNPIDYFKTTLNDLIGQSAYTRITEAKDSEVDLRNSGGSSKVDSTDDSVYTTEFTDGTNVETQSTYGDNGGQNYKYTAPWQGFGGLAKKQEDRAKQSKKTNQNNGRTIK